MRTKKIIVNEEEESFQEGIALRKQWYKQTKDFFLKGIKLNQNKKAVGKLKEFGIELNGKEAKLNEIRNILNLYYGLLEKENEKAYSLEEVCKEIFGKFRWAYFKNIYHEFFNGKYELEDSYEDWEYFYAELYVKMCHNVREQVEEKIVHIFSKLIQRGA